MSHRAKPHHKKKQHTTSKSVSPQGSAPKKSPKPLELVIKGDTDGCEDAVCETLLQSSSNGVPISIIHKGVGDICKTDILTAATGSRLVIGFNVDVLPKLTDLCREQDVEVRLYSVIYNLQEDVKEIAASLLPEEKTREEIIGQGKVIALFKSSRKGIILGLEVQEGRIQVGDKFRVITGMGPVFSGTVQSLHIEKDTVTKAMAGQQVGLKIENFNKVKIGDLVECFRTVVPQKTKSWQPSGKILHL